MVLGSQFVVLVGFQVQGLLVEGCASLRASRAPGPHASACSTAINRHRISKSHTKAPPFRGPRRVPNLQTLNREPCPVSGLPSQSAVNHQLLIHQ